MKLFGFYISRTDWFNKWFYQKSLNLELQRLVYRPRDSKGRFISKQKLMTDQLRKEVADGKYVPSDQVPHYDDIKKAGK